MKIGLLSALCLIAFAYKIDAKDDSITASITYQIGQLETINLEKTKPNIFTNDGWLSKNSGTLISFGSVMTVGGIFALVVAANESNKDMSALGYTLFGVGQACIATGIPIRIIGRYKENQTMGNILEEMKSNYPVLYSQYRSGEKRKTVGWILLGAGTTIFAFDVYWLRKVAHDFPTVMLGLGLIGASIGSIVTGIYFHNSGENKKNQSIREFNRHYYSSQTSSHFQLNVYSNRVGISYVF